MRRPSAQSSMETKKKTTERKLRKPASGDRLGSLPDEILCHILSYLPTKYAAGTSGLSRRWKDLWTELPELDLDYKDDRLLYGANPEARKRRALEFCRFVNRVLREHKDLNSLRRFRIHLKYLGREERPDFLLRMGLASDESQLEEMDVTFTVSDVGGSPVRIGWLPDTLYRLKLLKILKLEGVTLMDTSTVFLPSLKILQIVKVEVRGCVFLSNLISGCPVLETLHVEDCRTSNGGYRPIITASLLSLKNFTIVGHAYYLRPMRIEAPSLEHLYVRDFAALRLRSPLPSLHSAKVDIRVCSNRGLIRLLARISNAKEMELSWGIMSVLLGEVFYGDEMVDDDDDDDHDDQLLIFPNLTHLTIKLGSNLRHLHPFLKAAPRLQYLHIDLLLCESARKMKCHESVKPGRVPECLLSSLEAIEIDNVRTDGGDMDMVSYLLKAGAILKKVNVRFLPSDKYCDHDEDDYDEMCREDRMYRLLKAKKRSRACEVHVFGDYGEIRLDRDKDDAEGTMDDDEDDTSDDSDCKDSINEMGGHEITMRWRKRRVKPTARRRGASED